MSAVTEMRKRQSTRKNPITSANRLPSHVGPFVAITTTVTPALTYRAMLSKKRNRKNDRRLFRPMQLATHGQWWSNTSTQRLHTEQCFDRSGLIRLHVQHSLFQTVGPAPPLCVPITRCSSSTSPHVCAR